MKDLPAENVNDVGGLELPESVQEMVGSSTSCSPTDSERCILDK
jgi:hypothetical protein